MAAKNNILSFPRKDNLRFNAALDLYGMGRHREALDQTTALINDGYGHAYTLAGIIYEEGGQGVDQDLQKALFYYQKAVDEVGAVEAWLALGRLYYFGKGVSQDYDKAFYYYSVIDEDTENAVADLMLGKMYFEGTGIKKDLIKAREYFEKAIKKGAVFGYTYLSMLEKECGHIFISIFLRVKAGLLAFFISRQDPNDSRLRHY